MANPDPIQIRLLDLFRIGPGPSSSHTVGPMRAARAFRERCTAAGVPAARVQVQLCGSLGATGRGHGTDRAVLAGLLGQEPETCDCRALLDLPVRLAGDGALDDWGDHRVRIGADSVVFAPLGEPAAADELPHPNTMICRAYDAAGAVVFEDVWCSVGGGFVWRVGDPPAAYLTEECAAPAVPFHDAASLVQAARQRGVGIGDVVLLNERARSDPAELEAQLDAVWTAFRECIDRGLSHGGELPGLGLRRRARELMARLDAGAVDAHYAAIARAQAYAYAVNEENAAGGRVVTAPTNGAAGIVPAVLLEVSQRLALPRTAVHRAIATAGAVAMVIKTHASISGAEVGCQGEIGSATAMAAAALCEILGGTVEQVAYAAEMGLEHNLGLTCDPIDGLVQAPCIERNAMGVAKAWSAAQLAIHSDGTHLVSLDRVIRVMKRTGQDMRREYKETSEGGLAVTIPEC